MRKEKKGKMKRKKQHLEVNNSVRQLRGPLGWKADPRKIGGRELRQEGVAFKKEQLSPTKNSREK